MPKISQFPAQTGASVANGDLFPIVDVGSPNVSEYITADELAQMPQLTSRYVSKTEADQVWIGAGSFFNVNAGTSSPAVYGSSYGLAFDASSTEVAAWSACVPDFWTTYKVELYWSNAASSSGDVVLEVQGHYVDAGDNAEGVNAFNASRILAANATARIVTVSQFPASTNITHVSGKPLLGYFRRVATSVDDTLANDCVVHGIMLTRVS